MQYYKEIVLKDGRSCILRSCADTDAEAVLENFKLTHSQTDFLLTYPEESTFTAEQEAAFLRAKAESENEVEIAALVDGRIAGTAGIEAVGSKCKVRHRADFGISIEEKYWGLGIGGALLDACVECARWAGFSQLELTVVAENTRAVALYEKAGFVCYGVNPKGFRTKDGRWQALQLMMLEL